MRVKHVVRHAAILILAASFVAVALDAFGLAQSTMPRANSPGIHSARSIEDELDRLTRDLQLTAKQRREIEPLLQEHHDKIQALFDKYPKLSRQALAPRIHAISDATHRAIDALLSRHQKQLVKAMLTRMKEGAERRTVPR